MNAKLMSVALLSAAFGLIGCKSTPEAPKTAEIRNEVVVEADVTAVDPATREITVERDDGSQLTFVAGDEVRNFDQIAVGQKVKTSYLEVLSARLMDPDEPSIEPVAEVTAGRTELGEKPGVGIAAGIVWDVKVVSVDHEQHLVVLTNSTGEMRAVTAKRDEGKAFVEGLKQGDRVELMLRESVVLTVE